MECSAVASALDLISNTSFTALAVSIYYLIRSLEDVKIRYEIGLNGDAFLSPYYRSKRRLYLVQIMSILRPKYVQLTGPTDVHITGPMNVHINKRLNLTNRYTLNVLL